MQQDQGQEASKAALLRAAEAATADLLATAVDWQAEHPQASLEELETEVLRLRKEFGKRLGEVLLHAREARRPVPGPQCPECGREMHYKGEKPRQLPSTLGDLQLERGYYYCSACRQSVFPPG